jgi:hypothetical protein
VSASWAIAFVLALPAPPAWQVVPIDTQETIRDVRVDPQAGDLWVLAQTAIHRRLRDGTWSRPLPTPKGGLSAIYVVRPGLIYGTQAEGDHHGHDIMQYRDGAWSTIGRLDNCIAHDLPIEGSGNTVVAGCPYYSGLAAWKADDPTTIQGLDLQAPRDLALVGPEEVLSLSATDLTFVRFGKDGVKLPDEAAGHDALWADRGHIVTAGHGGTIQHAAWDPAKATVGGWAAHKVPAGVEDIADIWGTRYDHLVAIGRGGAILRFDGTTWSAMASPTTVNLLTVAGGASGVWAGGAKGTLLHHAVH